MKKKLYFILSLKKNDNLKLKYSLFYKNKYNLLYLKLLINLL